jgi:O-antigen/teichoic acid export membrane protein
MGAEPFFFNEAGKKDARRTYARVMKFFVVISCVIFLVVSLYADTIWGQYLTGVKNHPEYAEGIATIPVIALAYVLLGIYYNLTVWYKLTDKTIYGAYITIGGAVITVVFNYISIPYLGYWGSAWTTLICYGFMMVVSYKQGQKHYPIPYATKKLIAYVLITVLLYGIYFAITAITSNIWISLIVATVLLTVFILFIGLVEKKEMSRLPLISRLYKTPVIPAVAAPPVSPQASDNLKA